MKQRALILFIATSFCFSCQNFKKERVVVDFTDSTAEKPDAETINPEEIFIAIASMTSPKETYTYYSELVKFISEKRGSPIFIKQKKTYHEVNKLLENSEVDFAFICSGAYVDKSKGLRLLVAPVIENKTSYNAHIIAHKELIIDEFKDFKNKSFAFTDPLSNTGRLYPLQELSNLNETETNFFKKTIYTYGHDISIQMVNRGIIDGASVHGIIFDYVAIYHPERVKNIQIIKKSEDFGMPPVVVPVSLNQETFEQYQDIFLNLHTDSIGRKILEKLRIDRFVKVDDSLYKSVLQIKTIINNEKSE